MTRLKLLLILALMPDEAFSIFVIWASGSGMQYPSGLGGFGPVSQKSIKALRREAKRYIAEVAK